MDQIKMGHLIRQMRKKAGLTQIQLAERLCVSDKAVSKWERGQGVPDVSIFPALAEVFHVKVENLLAGELEENEMSNGNLKKMKFYICPACGRYQLLRQDACAADRAKGRGRAETACRTDGDGMVHHCRS